MNIISTDLLKHFELFLKFLIKIDFKGLSIKIVDYRYILLYHYTKFGFKMKDVVRNVKCFVTLKLINIKESGEIKHFNLILKIS